MLLKFRLTDDGFTFANPADLIAAASIDYIKCHFDITAKSWKSTDAVVAVFKSATYNKHAEVLLDSNNNCVIDPEIYKRGGRIQVKLIGDRYINESVISSTNITSILEFEVKENIIIPIQTPSKYDVFVAELEKAQIAVEEVITDLTTRAERGDFDGADGVGISTVVYNADDTITVTLADGTEFTSDHSLKGEKGDPGTPGDSIANITYGQDGTLTITLTSGATFTSEYSMKGEKGEKGDPGEGAFNLLDGIATGSIRQVNSVEEGTDDYSLGESAAALGYATKASGRFSFAEGSETTAEGNFSHAEGTKATAHGQGSHAEGYLTSAISAASHAEGRATIASGLYGHAEGWSTVAANPAAHAEGYISEARGDSSHAEGSRSVARAEAAHAEGIMTTASGNYAHAEGNSSTASGVSSHSEGNYTTASAAQSHSEGSYTEASGSRSHAEGNHTIANHASQHVFGEFNVADPSDSGSTSRGNYVEIVGKGTNANNRSNARTLDWSGNEALAGSLTLGKGTNDEITLTAAQLNQLLAAANPVSKQDIIVLNGTVTGVANNGGTGLVQWTAADLGVDSLDDIVVLSVDQDMVGNVGREHWFGSPYSGLHSGMITYGLNYPFVSIDHANTPKLILHVFNWSETQSGSADITYRLVLLKL